MPSLHSLGTVTDQSPRTAAAFDVTIATAALAKRMQERLRGPATAGNVVWQKDRQRLLIYPDSLIARTLEGWLLVNLNVETDQTKQQLLQFVFHVGKLDETDGHNAACTINAGTVPASQLVDPWGRDLQRVLWDAVLDAIEMSVTGVQQQIGGRAVTLGGFYADAKAIHVSVIPGEL